MAADACRLPALLVKTDSTKLPEEHDDNELGCPMRRAVLRHFESDTARGKPVLNATWHEWEQHIFQCLASCLAEAAL